MLFISSGKISSNQIDLVYLNELKHVGKKTLSSPHVKKVLQMGHMDVKHRDGVSCCEAMGQLVDGVILCHSQAEDTLPPVLLIQREPLNINICKKVVMYNAE